MQIADAHKYIQIQFAPKKIVFKNFTLLQLSAEYLKRMTHRALRLIQIEAMLFLDIFMCEGTKIKKNFKTPQQLLRKISAISGCCENVSNATT